MFNLFGKKEVKCQICLSPQEKRKYHFFDASYRGLYKNGEELKLCTSCLIRKYRDYLKLFKHRAVIIEPFKPFNAYQFYTFEDMLKYEWEKERVEAVKALLTETGKCSGCGVPAVFLLCTPEVYSRDPYEFIIVSDHKGRLLCSDCVCHHLEKVIGREQIFFDEVWPPIAGDGVATSFEC